MGDPFCPLSAMLFPMPRDDRIWSCRSGHGRRNWPRSEDQRSGGTAQGAPEHYSLSASRRPHSSGGLVVDIARSEEHTSELQSLMRTSYAVFCLKKKKKHHMSIHNKVPNHNTHAMSYITYRT